MATPAIYASACGNFVVSMFGAYPHVIPIEEARGVRDLYFANASQMSANGQVAAANMEMAVGSMITRAIDEADSFRSERFRRARQKGEPA